jgi:single-stranded-DNA-specific exonuclease
LCNFGETCACGEVFHFIRGIRWLTKKVNPIEFVSLAAIGILADVSPIIGDNRIIVKNGLNNGCLNNVVASGLNSLIRTSGIRNSSLSQEDVLFKIAPRINAVGRLSKPDMAYRLLIEQNPEISDELAQNLNEHNNERKKLQKKLEKEAIEEVEANLGKFPNAIALYKAEWPIGLVGLMASRLVEKFCKPAIVMGKNGDIIKGSGRSLENVNLKVILDNCKDVFENYGGHSMAAGVTVKSHSLNDVNDALNKACEIYYEEHGRPEEIRYYDAELRPQSVTLEVAEKIKCNLYPYCSQFNPEPVFLLSDATIVEPELFERADWKILSFYVSKDGVKTNIKFKMFSDDLGTEISGMKADVYFSFPQSFIYPALNVQELIFKK